MKNIETVLMELQKLISKFKKQETHYKSDYYKEAELRIDFINPLLKIFGWDIENIEDKSQQLRTVIQEESIDVEVSGAMTKKQPDYSLRVAGHTKLFVEVKKAHIDIEKSHSAAFQTRRYGWSANLGITILTNFETIIFYDCRYKPNAEDAPTVARYKVFHIDDFVSRIGELFELLSYESISSGYIDSCFTLSHKDALPFDAFFLSQIEKWRELLAGNIIQNNPSIDEESINFLIQRLLNRIIFLRICEDREIEKHEVLKDITSYDQLKELFIESDKKYNSGLFSFIEDHLSFDITLDSQQLITIFEELYYPASPFDFAVVDPLILSQIYEQYLGCKVALLPHLSPKVVEEPEVVASNGVVPTPKAIAYQIVSETLCRTMHGRTFTEIKQLKIADICFGSGSLLISLFDQLIQIHIGQLLQGGICDDSIMYKGYDNVWYLTLEEKRKILLDNIFGVDINPYAVEVTRFGLYLKLLENENAKSISCFLNTHTHKVLPDLSSNIKCGNSLVDNLFFEFNKNAIDDDNLLFRIKPFEWFEEFPFLQSTGGFDAIIGNPPYVRIQNLTKFSSEEIAYYKSTTSPFSVGKKDAFDKYYLFIERSISLINERGVLGCIVPHKFFVIKGGGKLRSIITSQCGISKIIHFGTTQVFPGRLTYTAIIVAEKKYNGVLSLNRIAKLNDEFVESNNIEYPQEYFSEKPWIFLSKAAESVFDKINLVNTLPLKSIAEIPVGLQSSADKIYILYPRDEDDENITIEQDGKLWLIEKSVIKPCIYDLKLDLFDTPKANSYIIFPYSIKGKKAILHTEEEMSKTYPMCWLYLNHHKEELKKRSINGSNPQWYQFGRSQSLTKFHCVDKLIWKVLSTGAEYTYDNSNLQFTGGGNGPFYSLTTKGTYSIYYILAILSHPLIEAMVKAGASEFQGDYYSHGKQFIENIPVRAIDFTERSDKTIYNDIIKLTKDIINTQEKIKTSLVISKTNILKRKYSLLRRKQIDAVNILYKITNVDIENVSDRNLFAAELNNE